MDEMTPRERLKQYIISCMKNWNATHEHKKLWNEQHVMDMVEGAYDFFKDDSILTYIDEMSSIAMKRFVNEVRSEVAPYEDNVPVTVLSIDGILYVALSKK